MEIKTSRRERRKQETRERVLDAAIACFVERGFDATTMQLIAERADVARATVFNHFQDKQALLTGYLDRRRARLVELLIAGQRANTAATQMLFDAFDLLADENERDPAETRELAGAWWRTGGSAAMGSPTEQILAAAITAGQDGGELRADVNAELAGQVLYDAYIGVVMRWISASRPPFPLRESLHEVAAMILEGLRR